jgi:glutamate transport system permease protein
MVIAAFGVPDLEVRPTISLGDAELLQFDFFFVSATAALGFYTAAFVCEALRSGINSIPLGQAEAARSVGMTFAQTLQLIILPQGFRAVIPPIASALIAMTKNTSVALGVGVAEATFRMRTLTNNYAADLYAIFIGFALFYMAIVAVIALGAALLERKLRVVK